MHKSAFPVVVRQTLNRAVYDVKQVEMPKASDVFVHRKKNFFKANSKVKQAEGFDINSMRATVGFMPNSDVQDSAVEDLEAQETGGEIAGRAFVPTAQNRTGNSWTSNVRAAGRWRNVKDKIVDSADSKAKQDAGKFYSSAKFAGVGGLVIGTKVNAKGNKMVWRIDSLGKKMKLRAMFHLKAGRVVEPEATHFMRKASLTSRQKMEGDFIMLAEKKLSTLK